MTILNRPKFRIVAVLPLLAVLQACESSSRLGSLMPGGGGAPSRVGSRAAPAPLTPAPVGEVYTSDLSGAGGAATTSLPPPSAGPAPVVPPASSGGGLSAPGNLLGNPVASGAAPIDPAPTPAAPPGGPTYYPGAGNAPPRVATAPVPAPSAAPSRTSVVGNWSVSEAQGAGCRMTLSSAPKLDLYGASANGCQTKELQRVNAWELSGSELLLYESGGGVVARLRQSGSGYSGATAKSGAPVSLSK